MISEDRKYIIKKLMQDTLTDEEQKALFDSPSMIRIQQKQWDKGMDLEFVSDPAAKRMWNKIGKKVWHNATGKRVVFYKIYSLVASVLIFLGVAGSAYFFFHEKELIPVHTVCSGILNMESVTLPDGTLVQLGPGSKITYPASFPGNLRKVNLEGQAFFDVIKDHSKPFIVQTAAMDVEALGTAFEVFGYAIEKKSEVVLLNGKIHVGIQNPVTGKKTSMILLPDEKLVFDKQSGTIQKSVVNADKYTSWRKQRILSFENEQLSMIIPRLEQWYGRNVICQKDLSERFRFTFKVRDESLERILFMISESSPLIYKKMETGDYVLNLK